MGPGEEKGPDLFSHPYPALFKNGFQTSSADSLAGQASYLFQVESPLSFSSLILRRVSEIDWGGGAGRGRRTDGANRGGAKCVLREPEGVPGPVGTLKSYGSNPTHRKVICSLK